MENTTKNRKIAVISLSGGMDSTCLLIKLISEGFEVHGVSFDYGQKHKVELERLQKNLEYLKNQNLELKSYNLIDLSVMGKILNSSLTNNSEAIPEGHYEEENMKSTVVPNRNMIFLSIVQSIALSIATKEKNPVKICLGVHSGDHEIYPDCRPIFYASAEETFQKGNWNWEWVSSYLPYIKANKTMILSDCFFNCKKLDLDFDVIMGNTNTSYNPDENGRSSGKSGSDIERIEAFLNCNLKDPVEYTEGWENAKKHALTVLKSK